jgi:hypothetical protein
MTCVRFAEPFSLGVTEPLLTQKMAFILKVLENGSEISRSLVGRPFFCVRNGSITPRKEGFAKQPQVMLLGGWSIEDVV